MHRFGLTALAIWFALSAAAVSADDAAAPVSDTTAERVDLKRQGAFSFPQDMATVLADTKELRLSAFSDNAHLYVQAILWNDDNDELGETSDGRPIGDHSSLCVDADANGEVTANVDRTYALNPWPTLPGLRYSILLGGGASTGLKGDSEGRGAIRYMKDSAGQAVRVDSFLIPLSEIGCATGETVRIAYWGSSTKPEFVVNSIGFETDRKKYWSHHLPYDDFHELELTAGELVVMPSAVPNGREDDVPEGAKPEALAKTPKIGEVPPELEAEEWINTDGPLTLETLRGKVVVVEFWATWCSPCVAGIPHLNETQEKYEKDGLRIVSFTDQSRSHVEQFMKEKPMHYALGTGSSLSRRYGVSAIPHAFIIGRDGKLIWHGHPSTKEFDQQVEMALREKVKQSAD